MGVEDDLRQFGLRERKKAKTISTVEQIGVELFLRNGYEETTIDEIVDRAEISRRTFFRYFRSKEDVLFSLSRVRPMALYQAVVDQPPDVPDRQCVRLAVRDTVTWLDTRKDISFRVLTLIEENASLHARSMQLTDAYASELAEGLAARHADRREGPSRFQCRLLAQVTVATCRVAMQEWWTEGGKRPIVRYLDDAFALLDALDHAAGATNGSARRARR